MNSVRSDAAFRPWVAALAAGGLVCSARMLQIGGLAEGVSWIGPEAAPSVQFVTAVTGYFVSVFALIILSYGLRGMQGWWRKLLVIFVFSLLLFLPYVPDTYSAFALGFVESGSGSLGAVAMTLLALSTLSASACLMRLPLIWVSRPNINQTRLAWLVIWLTPIFELSYLFSFPLLHIGSTIAPLPGSTLLRPPRHEPSVAVSGGQEGKSFSRTDVIVSSTWSDSERTESQEIRAKSGVWEKLIASLVEVKRRTLTAQMRVYFPETFFASSPGRVTELYEALALSEPRHIEVDLVTGVGSSANNQVALVGRDVITGALKVRQLAKKRRLVPFFEAPTLGISVWANASDSSQDYWSGLMPLTGAQGNTSFPQFLICYEALFPRDRNFGQDAVVFGNHHMFRRWRILSRAFDFELRLVSQLTGQRTLLVQNGGDAGVLQPLGLWSRAVGWMKSGNLKTGAGAQGDFVLPVIVDAPGSL